MGKAYLCNNASQIPLPVLKNIMRIIEVRSGEIVAKWSAYFEETTFFC